METVGRKGLSPSARAREPAMPRFPLGILALLLVTTPVAAAGPLDDPPGPHDVAGLVVGSVERLQEMDCLPEEGEMPGSGAENDLDACLNAAPLREGLACPWVEDTVACLLRWVHDNSGVGITSEEPVAYCIALVADGGVPEPEVEVGSGCTAAPSFLVIP